MGCDALRTLQIHALKFCFEPIKEAVREHDPKSPATCLENSLVVFVTIEANDTDALIPIAVKSIADHAKQIGVKSVVLYPYAHLSSNLAEPSKARFMLEALHSELSKLGYNVYKAPFGWYKKFLLEAAGHPLSELSRTIRAESEKAEPAILFSIESKNAEKVLLEYFERFGITISESGFCFNNYVASAIRSLLSDVSEEPIRRILHSSTMPHELEHEAKPDTSIVFPAYIKVKGKQLAYYEQAILVSEESLQKILSCRAERVEDKKAIKIVGSHWSGVVAFRTSTNKFMLNATSTFLSIIGLEIEKIKAGKTPLLPYSASPIQVYVATAGKVSDDFTRQITKELTKAGSRYYVDESNRSLGSKIRDAGRLWVPLLVIAGAREESTDTIVVRNRETGKQEVIKLSELEKYIRDVATNIGYCL